MSAAAQQLGHVATAYGDVIRSRRYFPLWLGQLISNFGDTIHYIALVVLVFQLTGRGVAVAGLVAAEIVPVLLIGPIAGVIIDRFSRKRVLIGADLARAALALSLVWPQGVWHPYLVAAGLSAGSTFFNPTVQAVIPVLTTEDQRLAANSVSWSTGRFVQIVASAVAGGLIGFVGTRPAFTLNAASFAASALLIATLAIPPHAGQLGEGTKRGLARPPSHSTRETDPLTGHPSGPMIGVTGLLHLVALVEKLQLAQGSRPQEGGALCPWTPSSAFPPAPSQGAPQSLGADPPSQSPTAALAAESTPRTAVGPEHLRVRGGRQ